MSEKYRQAFRGYLIDHHSPQPPTVTLDRLDSAEYRDFFRTAGINSLMLYCKDHWGYSYYDTALGVRHPALREDWVSAVSRILKEENIEFNAYYCLEYDTLAPRLHPEWSIRDTAGNPVRLKGRMAKWGMPCYETGYRQLVLGQLREIVAGYRPDSLFLDIFGKTLCYCPACRQKFRERMGFDLPEDAGAVQDEYQALDFGAKGQLVNTFLEDCAAEMLDEILAAVKAIDPTIRVTINFASLYPQRIRDKLDYQFTEPWAGNWLSAAYARDTARGGFPQLGPGDVSEVYNYRPQSIYTLAAAQIAANGCRVFFYSGSQHVDGTLEHEEARRIGRAYAEIRPIEPWLTDREPVADVAIIQSDQSTKARAGHRVIINAIGRCKQSDDHRQAILGAMTCCDKAQLSWTILPEQQVTRDTLNRYRLVILAGLYHVTAELAEALADYVRCGGRVLADSACGLYETDGTLRRTSALEPLLGCRFQTLLDQYAVAEWGGYIQPVADPIWQSVPDTLPPTGRTQVGVTLLTGRSLGWLRQPAVSLTDETWVNWWCPPPSAATSDWPALIDSRFGSGRVLYAAWDLFRGRVQQLHLVQALFQGMADQLLPQPSIRLQTEYPESVSFAAYRRSNQLIVHHLSHLAEQTGGAAPPVPGGCLLLETATWPVLAARRVFPDEQDLPVQPAGVYNRIELPPVTLHQLMVIDLIPDRPA